MAKKSKKSEEDLAKDYIQQYLGKPKIDVDAQTEEVDVSEHSKKSYQDIQLSNLPLGKLYHPGVRIEFRAADVAEIQHYSTIENDNSYDIRNKLNDILKECIKITLPNKKRGSYLDIKIGDRLYLIYTIREITFQKGKILSVPVKCSNKKCETSFEIEIARHNFEFWEPEQEIWNYYNPQYQAFVFETTFAEQPYVISPPTLGIQQSFSNWIKYKQYKKEKINDAFVKIAPYLINENNLNDSALDELSENFTKIGMDEFMFLNDTIDKFKNNEFKLGMRGLLKKCPECGEEVRTTIMFPDRASTIFIVPNAFDFYLKK